MRALKKAKLSHDEEEEQKCEEIRLKGVRKAARKLIDHPGFDVAEYLVNLRSSFVNNSCGGIERPAKDTKELREQLEVFDHEHAPRDITDKDFEAIHELIELLGSYERLAKVAGTLVL
jgi:hypothetical protein